MFDISQRNTEFTPFPNMLSFFYCYSETATFQKGFFSFVTFIVLSEPNWVIIKRSKVRINNKAEGIFNKQRHPGNIKYCIYIRIIYQVRSEVSSIGTNIRSAGSLGTSKPSISNLLCHGIIIMDPEDFQFYILDYVLSPVP